MGELTFCLPFEELQEQGDFFNAAVCKLRNNEEGCLPEDLAEGGRYHRAYMALKNRVIQMTIGIYPVMLFNASTFASRSDYDDFVAGIVSSLENPMAATKRCSLLRCLDERHSFPGEEAGEKCLEALYRIARDEGYIHQENIRYAQYLFHWNSAQEDGQIYNALLDARFDRKRRCWMKEGSGMLCLCSECNPS